MRSRLGVDSGSGGSAGNEDVRGRPGISRRSDATRKPKPGPSGPRAGRAPAGPAVRGQPPESAGPIARRRPVWALTAASLVCLCLIFAPWAAWPLGYVCLVPWVVAVCAGRRPRVVYIASYLLGLGFFLINLRWLRFSTFPGYVVLSIWSGLHFLVACWAIRHAYRRRGVLLVFAVPVVWTMTELARSRTAIAFPWFLLGHSQYRLLTMIQISDLAGALGVSFVLAAINGWLCDVILERVLRGRAIGREAGAARRRVLASTTVAAVLLVATIAYGRFRLSERTLAPGPKVAVLQGDYLLTPEPTEEELRNEPPPWKKAEAYMDLLRAAADQDPDLFLLPETPWTMYLNKEARDLGPRSFQLRFAHDLDRYQILPFEPSANAVQSEPPSPPMPFSLACHELFCRTAVKENAYLVVGSVSYEPHPTRIYPRYERFNSAFMYSPGDTASPPPGAAGCAEPHRYDKIHLVLFGEYVPFRYGRLHSVYRWLNSLTPWGAGGEEYSLSFGREHKIFEMHAPSRPGRRYRFAVPICYEDVIPQLIRQFVTDADGRKRVDFLLNISNDGWFQHSTELPQHLVCCAFRAVENRVAVARAVNTGVSGFIDPDGTIHGVVEQPGKRPWQGVSGYSVAELKIDSRHTLYSRVGDWLAVACAAAGLACLLDAFASRLRANWRRRTRNDDSCEVPSAQC